MISFSISQFKLIKIKKQVKNKGIFRVFLKEKRHRTWFDHRISCIEETGVIKSIINVLGKHQCDEDDQLVADRKF